MSSLTCYMFKPLVSDEVIRPSDDCVLSWCCSTKRLTKLDLCMRNGLRLNEPSQTIRLLLHSESQKCLHSYMLLYLLKDNGVLIPHEKTFSLLNNLKIQKSGARYGSWKEITMCKIVSGHPSGLQ